MSVRKRAANSLARHLSVLAVTLGAVMAYASDPAFAADPETPKLVVVFYPNESSGSPGAILTDRAIRSTFAAEATGRIDIRSEYVDTTRLHEAEFESAQLSLLRRKYAGRKVDLVIAGLSQGLDFVLEHRTELFPGVPVVFVAVDQQEMTARLLPPDVVGAPMRMDLAATLDIALRLRPDTRRVCVVAGCSPYDTYWESEARRVFRPYEDRLEFDYWIGLPMAELLGRVADLHDQSIVYYLHIFRDGTGNTIVPAEALERLAERSNVPIYGHIGTYLGRGIVGGRLMDFETEGKKAARISLRILAGENPESILVPAASENADMFDSRQLRRWGISEASLPPGSVVQHRELTFWDKYAWHVAGAAGLCILQLLLISVLLVQWIKRKRAERRFGQVVESSLTGMLLVGRDGRVTLANPHAAGLFGYDKQELAGMNVEALLPGGFPNPNSGERDRFFTTPEVRAKDVFARRKDGTQVPVEIALSPVTTARGMFVLASVIDITERRRAETDLETSRRELQRLTGRLLEAQELERRRIALELHDDINQTLALIAVEMDLLSERPPDSPARTSDQIRALSVRVKALSSDVHDLSHRLHPSKLEHLGLVEALRGLCKELAEVHDLAVKFTHRDVPPQISAASALCLYRVAQEGLWNAIKHSGAGTAAVELGGTASEVCLRITDDGVGFDPQEASIERLGLVSMRERLQLVGGEITIDSRPSAGTRIDARVPT